MSICKKISVIVLIGIFIISVNTYAGDRKIIKTFEAKKQIELETVSGDCIFKKGDNNKIEVTVVSEYVPRDSFEPIFHDKGDILRLKEKIYGSNSGHCTWTIMAPPGTDFDFSSASGSVQIEGFSGEFYGNTASGDYEISESKGSFELNTASGNIDVENCKGLFNLNTASGSIQAADIVLDDDCDFGSASGNVYVSLGSTPEFDIEVHSASGRAVLDYAGHPVKGTFELTAREDKGRIDAPFEFDDIRNFRRNGQKYVLKSITKDERNPVIEIKTASGKAELKE